MPGSKMGSKSVSNCVSNQIRALNSGRKTRSHGNFNEIMQTKTYDNLQCISQCRKQCANFGRFFFGVGASGRRPGSPPTPEGARGVRGCRKVYLRILLSLRVLGARGLGGFRCTKEIPGSANPLHSVVKNQCWAWEWDTYGNFRWGNGPRLVLGGRVGLQNWILVRKIEFQGFKI